MAKPDFHNILDKYRYIRYGTSQTFFVMLNVKLKSLLFLCFCVIVGTVISCLNICIFLLFQWYHCRGCDQLINLCIFHCFSGSIVGAVIGCLFGMALLVIIVIVICSHVKTKGNRGHVVRPTNISTVNNNYTLQQQTAQQRKYSQSVIVLQ